MTDRQQTIAAVTIVVAVLAWTVWPQAEKPPDPVVEKVAVEATLLQTMPDDFLVQLDQSEAPDSDSVAIWPPEAENNPGTPPMWIGTIGELRALMAHRERPQNAALP